MNAIGSITIDVVPNMLPYATELRRVADLIDPPQSASQRVHNHEPYRPSCNERRVGGQLRGACLNDDGTTADAPLKSDDRRRLRRAEAERDRLREQITALADDLDGPNEYGYTKPLADRIAKILKGDIE